MSANITKVAMNDAFQAVRQALSKGNNNMKDLCSAINKCLSNKSHRYVMSSVDSVFDALPPSSLQDKKDGEQQKTLMKTLFKLPRAVYMPRMNDVTLPGPNFGEVVDDQVEKMLNSSQTMHDYATLVTELGNTVEFMAEHSLNGLYGPLRPSALGMLDCYKQALIGDSKMGDLKKLTLAAQLLNILKLHSVDSEELIDCITQIIEKTPSIIRQCNVETLETLMKMKLPEPHKSNLDEYIRMCSAKKMDIEEWSKMFWMLSRTSGSRNTIDCYLNSHKIVLRNHQSNEKDKKLSNKVLMNTVYGIATLSKRLKCADPVFKNALATLESIWPFIEENISTFEPAELLVIADCYFENHKSVNLLMKNGGRNCLDFLIRECSRRLNEFLLKDWVSLLEAMNCIRDLMVVNVLMEKPDNYYIKVEDIQRAWTQELVKELKGKELTDIADHVYSLSFPQCSNLCKHLVMASCYEEPVSAIIERRCLSLITDVKYHTSRHIYDHYFLQFQMILPSQNGLRIALESNKPLRELLSQASGNSLLSLLGLARYCNPTDARLLIQKLSDRIESSVLTLNHQQYIHVLKHAIHFKEPKLVNAVLVAVTPQLLDSSEPHKGFAKLLDLSKYAMALPIKEDHNQSASLIINELIVQHAPSHVQHLSLLHLNLLLRNIQLSSMFPKRLVGDILSHAMDVDLNGITPIQVTSFIASLSDLCIRHDHLVDRLEHWLLMGIVDLDSEEAASVLARTARSMATIGMKRARLNEILERIVTGDDVPIARWDYRSLELNTKVNLLHAISLFCQVGTEFEKRFKELVEECEKHVKDCGDAVSFTKLDENGYRQLYDMYITLLISGVTTETTKSEFLQEHLPCYHWFRHQEKLCREFKDSPQYIQLKSTLKQIGIEGAESRVTEAYFAHMVFDSPECEAKLGCTNNLLYVVPPRDELKWWTSKGDTPVDLSVNSIESYKYTIGQSARVIDHLQKSGWNVITLFVPEWDAMSSGQRQQYLREVLKLKTDAF
ncbi:hypothetical protein BgAZ_206170 [Babesia gibsoni]|uniref:RAP domain-containing protein n=1 Tax=Babesia gibsoni TaxID=33632 RepID=A0AAD8LRM0_BABGI|nr:hypothetical protein BgAZ_206170 [Babesia gibsoni]